MKTFFCFALFILVACYTKAQQAAGNVLFSPVTTKKAKEERLKYLVDTTIRQYLREPLSEDNEGLWNDALWSLELLQYKDAFTKAKLHEAWSKAFLLSEYFQKNLLETTYSLYKSEFKTPVYRLMQQTKSLPVFLRCAEYVLRADSAIATTKIRTLIKTKFPSEDHIGLNILEDRLSQKHEELPPLLDLFSRNFLKGETVIYSLQRSNRDYPGIVVIRKPDGSFAKDSAGNIFHTTQLARAITAYPFYITNGNTPQGILRWTGFGRSRLLYIGPTTNLQMVMPFESKPAVFFADSTMPDMQWQKEMYTSMLPDTWKDYSGIYESFYAGAMGRYDVIMHGTTIDPAFYKNQTYFPQTPSLGCLCSYEAWDENGNRISSNQQQIADALQATASGSGYVVVINLDNKQAPVNINEISNVIGMAQNVE
ncbi:hypothetical protein I5907_03075 [Panacibacter sp. DH6]|uniref:Uncharacterized protein n=1 Tax=Panacibacter microcysteis TaxID=2793269 RepID=A0A931E306_9BACT|nr:hypothetical protein [Panacibacter microcysteis]MBG9375197.1 hypothetical protein [Panacibacter microcysteis]